MGWKFVPPSWKDQQNTRLHSKSRYMWWNWGFLVWPPKQRIIRCSETTTNDQEWEPEVEQVKNYIKLLVTSTSVSKLNLLRHLFPILKKEVSYSLIKQMIWRSCIYCLFSSKRDIIGFFRCHWNIQY